MISRVFSQVKPFYGWVQACCSLKLSHQKEFITIDIGPGLDHEPAVTAIEWSKKTWLIVLVYAALAVVLGRMAWTQIAAIFERPGGLQLQTADLPVLILLGVSVFLLVRVLFSLRSFIHSLRLDQNGEISDAVVIHKWRKRSSEDEDYWMAYEYGDG